MNKLPNTHKTGLLMLSVSALAMAYTPSVTAVECGDPCEITGSSPELQFVDTTAGATQWELETVGDRLDFGTTGGIEPFRIEDPTVTSALVIDTSGNIGIRTNTPQSFNELEIVANSGPGGQAEVALSPDGTSGDSGRLQVNATSDTISLAGRTGAGGYTQPLTIHLNAGNNALSINSSGRVGIGVNQAAINSVADLHVGNGGDIFLDETGTAFDWIFDPGSSGLWFHNNNSFSGPTPVKFENGAPTDSFVVDSNGYIGMGLSNPSADLHIDRDGANFIVTDTNPTVAKRFGMELQNNGAAGFKLTDTSNGYQWQFSMGNNGELIYSLSGTGGSEFRINPTGRVRMGPAGVANFDLRDNGNLLIPNGSVTANGILLTSSRASKTDITKIKTSEVMEKLKQIEVSEWRYKTADKNDRHISPMAEDFYALFQLGPDDKHINPNDLASVALIAAKELSQTSETLQNELLNLKKENAGLKKQLEAHNVSLKSENAELKDRLASLERLVTNLASSTVLPSKGEKVALNK